MVQKGYEDIMGDEERDLEIQNDPGETRQQQKKTVTSPFNAEPTGTEQHQSTLNDKKTAEQVYVGATGAMYVFTICLT